MSHAPFATLTLSCERATRDLGKCLASVLGPGDCVLLVGEIGAGKSVLSRAIIQSRLMALGQVEDVPSPTFTLVQTYDLGSTELWHCDLYRLQDPAEIDALGLSDAFETAITLIEWPDRLGDDIPPDALVIQMRARDHPPETRDMTFTALGGPWKDRLAPCLKAIA